MANHAMLDARTIPPPLTAAAKATVIKPVDLGGALRQRKTPAIEGASDIGFVGRRQIDHLDLAAVFWVQFDLSAANAADPALSALMAPVGPLPPDGAAALDTSLFARRQWGWLIDEFRPLLARTSQGFVSGSRREAGEPLLVTKGAVAQSLDHRDLIAPESLSNLRAAAPDLQLCPVGRDSHPGEFGQAKQGDRIVASFGEKC